MATTVIAHDNADIEYSGSWSAVSGFQETTQIGATLRFEFLGNTNVEVTMGEGNEHSIYDVYINQTLWQSYDGYAASPSDEVIALEVQGQGPHLLEVFQRHDKNSASSDYKVRFKQLAALSAYDVETIDYTYDNLSRLIEADYVGNRNYQYAYDVAGNRTYQETTIGITTTTTNWAFNAANQMTTMQIGANPAVNFSYDDNGNLLDDGTLTYTWDRANRLKTLNNGSYNTHFAYDGNGDRHQQNIGGTITNYLLDVQPELALVLQSTQGTDVTNYIHDDFGGIHSQQQPDDSWVWMIADGLGSVRTVVDANTDILESRVLDPYGQVITQNGTQQTAYGFTGELTDDTGMSYLRARYYDPNVGTFASLDPFEGVVDNPMSINGYSYVHGNPVNWTDPTGEFVNIIAGAIGGAVIGGALGVLFGVTQAEMTYYLAANGRCGCNKQQEVLSYGYSNFIRDFKQQGALFGATIGTLIGAGGPFASIVGGALTILGLAQSVETVVGLIEDFVQDGDIDNECRWVDFAFDLLDIAIGKVGDVVGKADTRWKRQPETPKNQLRKIDNQRGNPKTGIERFDRKMDGTPEYNRWKNTVEHKYGVKVREVNEVNNPGFRADYHYKDNVIEINTSHFDYLDMLHESRHLAQIKRLKNKGIVLKNQTPPKRYQTPVEALFERGAYEYEMRLAERYGFSDDYIRFVNKQLDHYWYSEDNKGLRRRFFYSPTLKSWDIWY